MEFGLTFWLTAAVTLVIWLLSMLLSSPVETDAQTHKHVRRADQPAVAWAGQACLRGDIIHRVLQLSSRGSQLGLRQISRGWLEAVIQELGPFDPSAGDLWTELRVVALLADRSVPALLAAKELALPGSPRFHLGESGRGLAVLLMFGSRLVSLNVRNNQLGDMSVRHIAAAVRDRRIELAAVASRCRCSLLSPTLPLLILYVQSPM